MTTLQETLNRMRASRATIQKELSAITEEQMTLPIPGRQVPADVRFLFYRLIAHEVEHTPGHRFRREKRVARLRHYCYSSSSIGEPNLSSSALAM